MQGRCLGSVCEWQEAGLPPPVSGQPWPEAGRSPSSLLRRRNDCRPAAATRPRAAQSRAVPWESCGGGTCLYTPVRQHPQGQFLILQSECELGGHGLAEDRCDSAPTRLSGRGAIRTAAKTALGSEGGAGPSGLYSSLSVSLLHERWTVATEQATLRFSPPWGTREKRASFF